MMFLEELNSAVSNSSDSFWVIYLTQLQRFCSITKLLNYSYVVSFPLYSFPCCSMTSSCILVVNQNIFMIHYSV